MTRNDSRAILFDLGSLKRAREDAAPRNSKMARGKGKWLGRQIGGEGGEGGYIVSYVVWFTLWNPTLVRGRVPPLYSVMSKGEPSSLTGGFHKVNTRWVPCRVSKPYCGLFCLRGAEALCGRVNYMRGPAC